VLKQKGRHASHTRDVNNKSDTKKMAETPGRERMVSTAPAQFATGIDDTCGKQYQQNQIAYT
jgi:hypothetical protein